MRRLLPWRLSPITTHQAEAINRPRDRGKSRASSVFRVFALLYLAIIAVVVPFTTAQGIDSRYLAPVYVPLLFVAAFWLDAVLHSKASGTMSVVRWALVALALVGVSVQQNLQLTAEALESGYIGKSLNTAYWEDSELVEYVRANEVPLPEYRISEIGTGQFVPGQRQIWKAEFTPPGTPLNVSVAKWLDNHTAAISITNDDWPIPGRKPDIDSYVMEQGLVMDYEVVTGNTFYGDRIFSGPDDERIAYLMQELVPKGFSYFGHGHDHIDHDELSYEEALESFQANYDTMIDWGMKPVAYAYPRSAGLEEETQRALEASGFLSGRLQTTLPVASYNLPVRIARYFRRLVRGSAGPVGLYNLPGSQLVPDNWFGLRALEMQSFEFQGCEGCINDNNELVPILDEALEQTAWVILTYHSIGRPEHFGWYDWDEFRKDVQSIAARDFWTASMNDITLYVRERENAVTTVELIEGSGGTESIEITLSDGLDNVRFNQSLTILFDQPTDWVGRPFTVSQDGELLDELVFDTEAAMLSLKPNERPYVLRPRP